jgi:hypothetical protein
MLTTPEKRQGKQKPEMKKTTYNNKTGLKDRKAEKLKTCFLWVNRRHRLGHVFHPGINIGCSGSRCCCNW